MDPFAQMDPRTVPCARIKCLPPLIDTRTRLAGGIITWQTVSAIGHVIGHR